MDIIKEYEPKFEGRMRYISEPDKGIYDAMNKGIRMATGDIIGILNSDDFYTSPDVLKAIAEAFEKEASLDAVYGDIHFVRPDRLDKCVRYYSGKSFKRSRMKFGFMPPHPSFYARRECYKKYGLYKTDYKICADFEFMLRTIYLHQIKTQYIPMDMVTMRMGGASTAGLAVHKLIMQEHLRAYRENGLYTNVFLQSLRYLCKLTEFLKTKIMNKVALITGITGQDGSFLAEFLIEKGYEVHGIMRRSSSFNTGRIEHLYLDEWVRDMKNKRLVNLHWGDMTDSSSLVRIIREVKPDEIYNLAAQSHVKVSFDVPEYTAEADAVGTLRLLEAVRLLGYEHRTKIYQASTSELFGLVQEVPQKETTPFYPRSPYGVAKQYGFWITKNYRESYGMFAVNGILFNHESERRGETFVTRKITLAAARIKQGHQDKLYLGNLNALRDWGYAKDYVECMWLILQHETPEDFVIATGEYHTVREFCTLAFHEVGIELRWEGEGVEEKGIDVATGRVLVEVDPKYFRPAEVEQLLGDPTKAKTLLGWNPRKTSFEQLVKIMVEHDMKFVKKLYLREQMKESE